MRSELQLLTVMVAGIGLLVIAALLYPRFGDAVVYTGMRIMHICVHVYGQDPLPNDLRCPR